MLVFVLKSKSECLTPCLVSTFKFGKTLYLSMSIFFLSPSTKESHLNTFTILEAVSQADSSSDCTGKLIITHNNANLWVFNFTLLDSYLTKAESPVDDDEKNLKGYYTYFFSCIQHVLDTVNNSLCITTGV